jgi:signal transduction histidine kinase
MRAADTMLSAVLEAFRNPVVADSGPGLSAEALGRLWQPFASTKARGHGLGLALIGRIVRAHDATIEVQSEPGRGATFVLNIPTASGGDQPCVSPAPPVPLPPS